MRTKDLLMIVVHSFKSLQGTFEARASEWALTGAVISLSIVFFLNDSMFYKETFDGLRNIINSQLTWAWVMLTVGLFRLIVLLINGAYWRTPHFRALTAFASAGIWFLFCVGFARNGSVLIAVAPWIFLLDSYNVKRASKEAGRSEFIQRYIKKQGLHNAGVAWKPQH